jgi:dTMP kinase
LMLVFAARAQHVQTLIKPALARGDWVICDRFTDSTYAYQGGGRQMSPDLIQQIDLVALDQYQPDITILLDLPVEVGLERAGSRGELDRFELESKAFFSRVRDAFLNRASQDPDRFIVIDAGLPLSEVSANIVSSLRSVLNQWQN